MGTLYSHKATFKSKVMKGLYKTHYCCPDPLTKSVQSFPKGRKEEEEEEDVAVGNGCVTDVGSCWEDFKREN